MRCQWMLRMVDLRSIQASTEGRLYRSPVTAAGTRFVHTHSVGHLCTILGGCVCPDPGNHARFLPTLDGAQLATSLEMRTIKAIQYAATSIVVVALVACTGGESVDAEGSAIGNETLVEGAPSLAFGASVKGTLAKGQMSVYRFTVAKGDTYKVIETISKGDLTPDFTVYSSSKISSSNHKAEARRLEKTYQATTKGVLGGKDRLAQKFGRIFYSHDSPTLFAKFADKSTILGKDAHGLLGTVVRQGLQAGQVGVDGRRGQSHHGGDRDGQSGEDGQQVLPPTGHLEREMMNGLNTKNVVEINELLLGFNPDY